MSDWGDDSAPATGGGFGKSNGGDSKADSGFGGGFGKPSRGFGGRGRGFGNKDDETETKESSGWGGGDSSDTPGFPSRGGGGRGGYKGRSRDGGDDDNNDDSGGGFGGRRGGRGGGFGRSRRDENGDDDSGGGYKGRRDNDDGGGYKGRRDNDDGGGFKGRKRGDDNGDNGGGFGRRGGDEDGDGEVKKREIYIPPAPSEKEDEMFDIADIGINFEKYQEIPVEVTGREPPPSVGTFEECKFYETTSTNVTKCGYKHPTPVQKYAIPIISGNRDLMACAQTGSGKTAAFLLPVITRLIRENTPGASSADNQSPEVLIISPTRELTLQIYNEARKFVHTSIYRPVVIYGGTSVGHQLRQLENGCNILVATPGRLMDFLNRKKVLLDNLKVLILDEADRMLDMGFEPEIRKVVEQFNMPDKGTRQTLMFSATFPEEIQRLASDFLHDHLFLTVGVVGGTTSDILQNVVEVGDDSESDKREKLQELLLQGGTDRVLVFVETKRTADFLAGLLCQENFPTTSIHGDRYQREREEALRDFRSGRCPVLVATSVAARGLDIPKVKHVINYDLPSSIEEYVHRIGRTGRIGNQGKATAFFQSHKDGNLARSLVKVLSDANQEVPDFLEQAAAQAVGTNYGPAGGKFASKDIRQFGGGGGRRSGGGFGGDSSGFGNDSGGFGTGFDEAPSGGTFNSVPPPAEDDEW